MLRKLYLLLPLLFALFASNLSAQIPRTITYQGMALENGQPIAGAGTITVSLYTTLTGGTPIYTEVHPNVNFNLGVFAIVIGSNQSIPATISFEEPYYLGLKINDGAELLPRSAITTAPYALVADKAREAQSLSPTATGVVTSINNQSGLLTLEGAGATTVTASGNKITISSSGGSGATGIQGVQSINASISIQDPNGPIANLALNENAVKTPNLFDGAVTTIKLANNNVTNLKLADDAVTSSKIADGSVGLLDLENGSVITPKLADQAVTGSKITDGAVTNVKLADGSVSATKIADATITTAKLTDGAVSTTKLADASVTATKLATDAVTSDKIAANAVTSAKILDGSIATLDLASSSVTNAKISSTGAFNGQILTANGTGGAVWQNPATLTLPFTASNAVTELAFDIQATGAAGGAGRFRITNAANPASVMTLTTNGTGSGLLVQQTNAASAARAIEVSHAGIGPGVFASTTGGNAIWGITSSISAAGVIADNTFGEAVVGRNRGGNGVGAVVGRNDSSGYGVRGFNTKTGTGVLGQSGISGGTGVGGRFENVNASNTNNALEALTSGNGSAVYARNSSTTATAPAAKIHVHPSSTSPLVLGSTFNGTTTTNVFRIDKTGKGFFNGGTQNSGADVAEAFAVVGEVSNYEPGDVLVIASGEIRTVSKSSTPYSTAVLGVHATKPGVLLTEVEMDGDMSGLVPMGVMGVIPTKVTSEGGPIQAGDLLVTSSTSGHAMRADPSKLGFGMVLGKALQEFSGETGVIQVFVNVR